MSHKHLTPHDRYFRSTMSHPNAAREFFQHHLPNNIKNVVNIEKVRLQKDSFIDDKLKLKITDLLFTTEFNKKTGYIYLLVEHQSTPNKLMPFRIFKYVTAIMEHHLRTTKSEQLPIVYPMIFYNGHKPYNYSTNIFDLFEDNIKLAKNIFRNPLHLIDLSKLPDEEFKSMLWYGITARTMKHIFKENFLPIFKNLIDSLKALEDNDDLDYIYTTISYVFEAGNIIDLDKFRFIIKNGLTKVDEEKLMTLAELCRQEGKKEGKKEGKLEAYRTIAIEMLKLGINPTQIATLTSLTPTEIAQLKEQIH